MNTEQIHNPSTLIPHPLRSKVPSPRGSRPEDMLERGLAVEIQETKLERPLRSGFRVQGSGFRVQGSGFRVQGSGFRVQGAGFRVQVS